MEEDTGDDCVPREVQALLSNERVILRETGRAVTPFGGVAVFVAYLRKVGFVEKLSLNSEVKRGDDRASL
jgi:hypothetical protein